MYASTRKILPTLPVLSVDLIYFRMVANVSSFSANTTCVHACGLFCQKKLGVDSLRNGVTVRCEFKIQRTTVWSDKCYTLLLTHIVCGTLALWNFEDERSVIHFDPLAYLLLWWSLTWETTEAALLLFLSTGNIGKCTSCPETISQDCNRWIAISDSRRSLSIQ